MFGGGSGHWSLVRQNINHANYLTTWSPVRWIRKQHAFTEVPTWEQKAVLFIAFIVLMVHCSHRVL